MNIRIVNTYNPQCTWCEGKGTHRQIVDHDEWGAVWQTEPCWCKRQQVMVDGNPLEHILIALGYKG